jgi:hypothetical protein
MARLLGGVAAAGKIAFCLLVGQLFNLQRIINPHAHLQGGRLASAPGVHYPKR